MDLLLHCLQFKKKTLQFGLMLGDYYAVNELIVIQHIALLGGYVATYM